MVSEVKNHHLELSYEKAKLLRLVEIVGLIHDFGKGTTWFQSYIRHERKGSNYTHHSQVSAIVAYFLVQQELQDDLLSYFAFQVVLCHHGNLRSFDMSNNEINFGLIGKQLENIKANNLEQFSELFRDHGLELNFIENISLDEFAETLEDFIDEYEMLASKNEIEIFFLNNYVFSLLIDSDKSDAARLENSYFQGNFKKEYIA